MTIKVDNLNYSYTNNKPVLTDISFEYKDTKTIAIVGASGSGKSTLLRLLSGNITSIKRSILIDTITPKENTLNGNIGFMFQEPTLMPNLTVEENVILPLKLKGIKDFDFANVLINKVGLTAYKAYLPSELSGGMKTRVALARTFVIKPKLILLDEPFGALDVKWKTTLYRELETLRAEFNATLLIVTHDIQEALLLSNDILVLNSNGKLLEKININKKLPRVFNDNAIFSLQDSYSKIKKLIMEN
ncbi:ABC transporter ATP-binding protein [Kordia jejudonensis]|uniref:ABC transporter ATP-binding protein n=1 Tax=Kordia jejudonensis TaxID=1348245 RepID=UPI00138DD5D7|nr:ABC transporter ATP-binding protein [Kordia jejudonensis]